MSAATRIARNRVAHGVLHQGALSPRQSLAAIALLRGHALGIPSHLPVFAVARHSYATETSPSGVAGSSYPPPGFDADKAKKPVAKEVEKTSKEESFILHAADKAIADIKNATASVAATGEFKAHSQADASLDEFAVDKLAADKIEHAKSLEGKKAAATLTLWQKVKKEVQHYWDGTKLLATEVKISSKLALKMAGGYELSRRENRQLERTVQDLARLVPFSIFIIVPLGELLLPVALKLFPNLLPSTYEGQKDRDKKIAHLRSTRKDVSNFLRNTLTETGLPVSRLNAQKEEFTEFFRKVRSTGEAPTQADVIKVCQIFKDDLTLDNLSRPQLVGMCRYMNLSSYGTDPMLRYHIRHRMRQIKRDDRAISFEGVDSLSVPELQMACASRGLRTQGMSPGRLRDDLQLWLDLRLKYGVPSTLLVLSNAFMYSQSKDAEMGTQIDALQAVLSSIPEELFHEIELEVHNAEGAATNKQRLEVLKEQQELIEEENEQSEESGAVKSVSDHEDIDEKEVRKANEREAKGIEAEAQEAEGEREPLEQTSAHQETKETKEKNL